MFINIVHFPKIKDGKDHEFRQWFAESNRAYAKHSGFIRRMLLQPRESDNYVAVVEHESYDTLWLCIPASRRRSFDHWRKRSSKATPSQRFMMS